MIVTELPVCFILHYIISYQATIKLWKHLDGRKKLLHTLPTVSCADPNTALDHHTQAWLLLANSAATCISHVSFCPLHGRQPGTICSLFLSRTAVATEESGTLLHSQVHALCKIFLLKVSLCLTFSCDIDLAMLCHACHAFHTVSNHQSACYWDPILTRYHQMAHNNAKEASTSPDLGT